MEKGHNSAPLNLHLLYILNLSKIKTKLYIPVTVAGINARELSMFIQSSHIGLSS